VDVGARTRYCDPLPCRDRRAASRRRRRRYSATPPVVATVITDAPPAMAQRPPGTSVPIVITAAAAVATATSTSTAIPEMRCHHRRGSETSTSSSRIPGGSVGNIPTGATRWSRATTSNTPRSAATATGCCGTAPGPSSLGGSGGIRSATGTAAVVRCLSPLARRCSRLIAVWARRSGRPSWGGPVRPVPARLPPARHLRVGEIPGLRAAVTSPTA
jgi:hypothetical protein